MLKFFLMLAFISLATSLKSEEIRENPPMFAVIYRGYVKAGWENQYQAYWKIIASYFIQERGALESTLHKAADGMYVAYSKWPNQEMRNASWPPNQEAINAEIPPHIQEAIKGLKQCLDADQQLPELCMEVLEEVRQSIFVK